MDGEVRHLVGLLLGTEDDWPRAFESCSGLGPVCDDAGRRHVFDAERADHRTVLAPGQTAHDLIIDRLAYWYYHPREWLKKVALMDDVYLLNSPFTFQAMEKHAAYCAMIRLGLKVPETVLVPYKNPLDHDKVCLHRRSATTVPSISTRSPPGRVPDVHEAVRRRRMARSLARSGTPTSCTVRTTSPARC